MNHAIRARAERWHDRLGPLPSQGVRALASGSRWLMVAWCGVVLVLTGLAVATEGDVRPVRLAVVIVALVLLTLGRGTWLLLGSVAVAVVMTVTLSGPFYVAAVLLVYGVAGGLRLDTFTGAAVPGARRHGLGWVVGEPGIHVVSGDLGQAGRIGADGERRVARDVENLVRDHGGMVIYGLRFRPGSTGEADLDIAYVDPDGPVTAIDVKNYARGTWRLRDQVPSGARGRHKMPFLVRGRDDLRMLNLADSAGYWSQHLARPVRPLVVLAGDPRGYVLRGRSRRLRTVTRDRLARALAGSRPYWRSPVGDDLVAMMVAELHAEQKRVLSDRAEISD